MPRKPEDAAVAQSMAQALGGQLRRLRLERQWTQLEVAAGVDLALESYARIERGLSLPSFPTLDRLAALWGLLAGDLVNVASGRTDRDASIVWSPIREDWVIRHRNPGPMSVGQGPPEAEAAVAAGSEGAPARRRPRVAARWRSGGGRAGPRTLVVPQAAVARDVPHDPVAPGDASGTGDWLLAAFEGLSVTDRAFVEALIARLAAGGDGQDVDEVAEADD